MLFNKINEILTKINKKVIKNQNVNIKTSLLPSEIKYLPVGTISVV